MKLFQEFKSIDHDSPKLRKLIAECDDIDVLKKKATAFASSDGLILDDNVWTYSVSSPNAAHIMCVNDQYELVIRP